MGIEEPLVPGKRPTRSRRINLSANTRAASAPVSSSIRSREFDVKKATTEETIKLIQRLFVSTGTATPQVVVFAAVEHGCGCTWVCTRLAEALAIHVEGSVCLVDANFRAPLLSGELKIEETEKVSNEEWLLAPARLSTQSGDHSKLWLLSYTPLNGDWQTPLSLERFRARIADLRNEFRYVLIDAPPINRYADASLLGRIADGLVMILEANKTRRETCQRAKETLETAGVPLLGVVLNKRTFPIPEGLYHRL
jgi:Mrp family chromosome partitioning ATPase